MADLLERYVKKCILLIIFALSFIYCGCAKERNFGPNDSQETVIKTMKINKWKLLDEENFELKEIQKRIQENKQMFSGVWTFTKCDDDYSMFYGFKSGYVIFDFCAGYIRTIIIYVSASSETITLQRTNFINKNKLIFFEKKDNEFIYLDSKGNSYSFEKIDESMWVVKYKVKDENLYYNRKLRK